MDEYTDSEWNWDFYEELVDDVEEIRILSRVLAVESASDRVQLLRYRNSI